MRILTIGDVHLSTYSSILRSRGDKYSTRLEGIIKSLNWCMQLSKDTQSDLIVLLGDLLDTSSLNAEELTALQDIKWRTDVPIYMLVGNHEMFSNNLKISSSHLFNLLPNFYIVDTPTYAPISNSIHLDFIPYVCEDKRHKFQEYLSKSDNGSSIKRIVFSHNDLKGIQYGKVVSQKGFELDSIRKNCDIFINGHIHNGGYLFKDTTKYLNLGNLTGQNFSEDASKYPHNVALIDTDIMDAVFIENPYAFNFYKIEAETEKDLLNKLKNIKSNSVVTIKCPQLISNNVKDIVKNNPNIIESRIILDLKSTGVNEEDTQKLDSIDHIQQFKEFIKLKLGDNAIIDEELIEVCK